MAGGLQALGRPGVEAGKWRHSSRRQITEPRITSAPKVASRIRPKFRSIPSAPAIERPGASPPKNCHTGRASQIAMHRPGPAAKFPQVVALLRFLMIFPARGIEARGMRHDDLDLDAGTFTIPASRYKTGHDKVFPMGPLQITHLRSLPRWSEVFVFPSPSDPSQQMRKEYQRDVWQKVRPKPLGSHTLRKTIGT